MNIYFICNNLLSSNISFDLSMDIEEKKRLRPLSIEGSEFSKKINLTGIENIYSSTYLSCIETGKYLSEKSLININLNKELNDCSIGNLKNQSLKMLSYFQEHDFDYKLPGGESLNECAKRIGNVVETLKKSEEDVVVFLPRRALFSYLGKFSDHGFNLEERLVLTKDDEILMEPSEEALEIFKVNWIDEEINISKISMEV